MVIFPISPSTLRLRFQLYNCEPIIIVYPSSARGKGLLHHNDVPFTHQLFMVNFPIYCTPVCSRCFSTRLSLPLWFNPPHFEGLIASKNIIKYFSISNSSFFVPGLVPLNNLYVHIFSIVKQPGPSPTPNPCHAGNVTETTFRAVGSSDLEGTEIWVPDAWESLGGGGPYGEILPISIHISLCFKGNKVGKTMP